MNSGKIFYEEYPTELPNYTLNGFMFTLIGLYDMWQITGDNDAEELFNKGMDTLIYSLPYFDNIGVSLYHLNYLNGDGSKPHYSTSYHKIHVNQLQLLNQISPNYVLEYYLNRWISYIID